VRAVDLGQYLSKLEAERIQWSLYGDKCPVGTASHCRKGAGSNLIPLSCDGRRKRCFGWVAGVWGWDGWATYDGRSVAVVDGIAIAGGR